MKYQPYWIVFPSVLAKYFNRKSGKEIPRSFIGDVLWAQYCVFLFVRIQDDLLDKQATGRSLSYVAHLMLLEAERILEKHFSSDPIFGKFYRSALSTTIRAILEVERLQQSQHSSPEKMLDEYAKVNAIFKIGIFAVCYAYEDRGMFKKFSVISDCLAKGSQVYDDLMDIPEDVKQGRYNFATLTLLRHGKKPNVKSKKNLLRDLFERLFLSSKGQKIVSLMEEQFEEARRRISPLGLKKAELMVIEQAQSIKQLTYALGQQKLRYLFQNGRSGARLNL